MARFYDNMSKCKDDETVFLYPVINYEIIRVATKESFGVQAQSIKLLKNLLG